MTTRREQSPFARRHPVRILETSSEDSLRGLAHLACRALDVPIACVVLAENDDLHLMSSAGMDASAQYEPFFRSAVQSDSEVVVEDTGQDARFADTAPVSGNPGIRFFAGLPLIDHHGQPIGAMCVFDTAPRTLTEEDRTSIDALTGILVDALTRRLDSLQRREILESIDSAFFALDDAWQFTYVNQQAEALVG